MLIWHPTIVQKMVDVYKMITFPNAKINIGLNVINRRSDGYHNLETVFYPVKINDALEIIESDELLFTSDGLDIPGREEDNLCIKAYHLMRKDADIPPIHIHLYKHIPIGAGLGGGSSDAAFFLTLLNDKFKLGFTMVQLQAYASQLGADCGFFLFNKPVFAQGIGDELTEIEFDLSDYFIVVVKPDVHVSTGEAYRGVKPAKPQRSLKELIVLPVEQWKEHIHNDFEASVFKNHPSIRGVKAAMYEAGAIYSAMSGSGSSVFGIFREKPDLRELERKHQVFYGV